MRSMLSENRSVISGLGFDRAAGSTGGGAESARQLPDSLILHTCLSCKRQCRLQQKRHSAGPTKELSGKSRINC